MAADLYQRLGDGDSPAHQIQSLDPQAGGIAPSQAGVGKQQDHDPVLLAHFEDWVPSGGVGEVEHLLWVR